MQGIELSRRFYNDIVRPWLAETAPDLRHTAANNIVEEAPR